MHNVIAIAGLGQIDTHSVPVFGDPASGTMRFQLTGAPPAPGQCGDGSGNWLPSYRPDGSLEPVCPSDPRYQVVARAHGMGQSGEVREDLTPYWVTFGVAAVLFTGLVWGAFKLSEGE